MSTPPPLSPPPPSPAEQAETYLRHKVKAELRKRLRAVRHTAPAEACAQRSRKIVTQLEGLEVVQRARTVALFWPIEARHEVDLRALDASLRARGVTVAYPSVDEETREMTFRVVADVSLLEERGMGFAEPSAQSPVCGRGELDVIIVPAIAIDPRGHRIGYGAGFYDRTLPNLVPPAVPVGVAYDYQLVADVPDTEGDVPVDWIVTDTRVLAAER
jgi:5-formyltetrahydrofolate cyclo-ligase